MGDATRKEKPLERYTWAGEKPYKKTVWVEVCSMSVKDEMMILGELLQWIETNTPKGVSKDDIMVCFVYYDEPYYYDEILTGCDMCLMVKKDE